jgi:hypothetical protein
VTVFCPKCLLNALRKESCLRTPPSSSSFNCCEDAVLLHGNTAIQVIHLGLQHVTFGSITLTKQWSNLCMYTKHNCTENTWKNVHELLMFILLIEQFKFHDTFGNLNANLSNHYNVIISHSLSHTCSQCRPRSACVSVQVTI